MIIFIYRFLKGYLRVKFYGDFKERALSICATGGIRLWSTKLSDTGIESNISVNDFKYLRSLLCGKNVRVHILKKRGFPFFAERYKKRWGILVGALLFFVVLSVMSQYIWIIDVVGNNKITDKEILSACESIGICEGIEKYSFYPKIAKEKLMIKVDSIAWASMNIEGSRLTINITETKNKDEEKWNYTNLKAKCDGVIEKLDIVSGTSLVSIGQAVKKGDLLVSGIIETADGTRYVKSKGTVIAKSQTEVKLYEEFKQTHNIPTGKVKTKCVLELFGLKIPLFLGQETRNYKSSTSTDTFKLFGSNLPIKIHKKLFEFKKKV